MKTEMEKLLDNMSRHYENIYNLLLAFQSAGDNNYNDVDVKLLKEDGTYEIVKVNSFQSLQSEITRISNNFSSLTNTNNTSYILNKDGSLSQYTKTTFMNAEYLENFTVADTCIVDKVSNIADFIYPLVKIPITVDATINADIVCRTFEISDGWEHIAENVDYTTFKNLISTGQIIVEKELTRFLKLEKEQIKYFGKFNVESITNLPDNKYKLVLNTTKYTGLDVNGSNIELRVNDVLVSSTGSSKYIIQTISIVDRSVVVARIAGAEMVGVGIAKLLFNQTIDSETKKVGIPVSPMQKIVAFLSTEHVSAISYPSNAIKIDTENYQVTHNGETYTIDEFFTNYVTNISEYLLSIVEENAIPLSLGITPDKPKMLSSNFKVAQINKHVTDSKSILEINQLNEKKQIVSNNISKKNEEIETLKSTIGNSKTVKEKQDILSKISKIQSDIQTLNTNMLTISRSIDESAINNSLKNIAPKYRILGFWHIQNNITSSLTGIQKIIKYDVQYRYLSTSSDKIETTSYKVVDDGKEISVTFSPWNNLETTMLNKSKNIDGYTVWEIQDLASSDDVNINQCVVPIRENESVEIRVRAVSEAGYPIAPLKSEWSDIMRVDFPEDLKVNKITSVIEQNETDLANAGFMKILSDVGLSSHIAGQITEAEKVYHHMASMIASGLYTQEMKIIPLDEWIKNIAADMSSMKTSYFKKLSLDLIDFNNETYSINNGSTIDLFAGNYSEEIDIHSKTQFGSIIRKKSYIKLKNNNDVPIELKTLKPENSATQILDDSFYGNVPVLNYKDSTFRQVMKQVVYFRNTDNSLQHTPDQSFDLYKANENDVQTNITESGRFDESVADVDKNAFVYDGTAIRKGKYIQPVNTTNQNFAIFTSENPVLLTNNEVLKVAEFTRISKMTRLLKDKQYQNQLTNGVFDLEKLGFDDNDFYSIGLNTCGSFLYPQFPNVDNIKVKGDSSDSTLVLEPGQEILIPIVYEYRMMDRWGNVNGDSNFDYNNELIYSKKLGIDMIVNNVKFQFDIKVSSKFKSKISSVSSTNFGSVISANNNIPNSDLN